ncbi:hypothetical protein T484DRAFT_1967519 [Baffinella frigidus]|nr:hypothetical protein T484DRAFT_1967519 [Cryptophyta sp. CCMP2293]
MRGGGGSLEETPQIQRETSGEGGSFAPKYCQVCYITVGHLHTCLICGISAYCNAACSNMDRYAGSHAAICVQPPKDPVAEALAHTRFEEGLAARSNGKPGGKSPADKRSKRRSRKFNKRETSVKEEEEDEGAAGEAQAREAGEARRGAA